MQKTKSHASVLQLGALDKSSEDVADQIPIQASTSNKSIRPTSLDFARFFPWLCAECQSPQFVNVMSVVQEEYVSVLQVTSKAAKAAAAKSKFKAKEGASKINNEDDEKTKINIAADSSKPSQTSFVEVPLILTATFDAKSHLVEIAITERYMDINRKTLQALGMCVPFYCMLTRLTLRWAKLDNILIYEIAKFLPNSNITDVILDDTRGQPNYDVLLSKKSPLKYLSLNRCQIDDDQCKKIAASIDYVSCSVTLNVLELGSNLITDVGAIAIAESLRRNRNLMHLNLSGNMITDEGAVPLLSHLMKFQMRLDEIMETKKRKRLYVQNKLKTYESCLREVEVRRQKEEYLIKTKSRIQKTDFKSNKLKGAPSAFFADSKDYGRDEAAELTLQRVGEFVDPFDERSTIKENGWTYCTGNMVLCSLNLAYNNLSYIFIKKIHEVLKYQNEMISSQGLIRIVFVGNQLPVNCELYSEIAKYLLDNKTANSKPPKRDRFSYMQKPKFSKIKMV